VIRPHFFLAIVLGATAAAPLLAYEPSEERATNDRSSQEATPPSYGGKLKRNDADRDGSAPYVLVDKWGRVEDYVRPEPGLDLQPYLQRQVWIESAGTVARFDGMPCVKAAAVTLGDRPATTALRWLPYHAAEAQNPAPERPVRQAAYEEPARQPQGERIPAPQPIPSSASDAAPAAVPEPAQMLPVPDSVGDDGPDAMPGAGPEGCYGGCPQRCGPPCGGGCSSPCCCSVAPYWVDLRTLLWWTRGMETPPLVTTGTSASQIGALGLPGTTVLVGGGTLLDGMQVGGQLQAGLWLNHCGTVGMEGDFLALGGTSFHYRAWSNGTPILARPFMDTNPDPDFNGPEAEAVAVPLQAAGSVSVDARTWFETTGVDARFYLGGCERCWSSPCDPCTTIHSGWRADLLLGYRYLRLQDHLSVTEELTELADAKNPNSSFYVEDDFDTRDQFNGGEIGLRYTIHRNRWSLEATPRIAFGTTHEQVGINGYSVITAANGITNTYPGGLLAQTTNIGNYSKNELAVVPQIALTLGYQLTPRLQATFGYSFLYWSRVARAGNQIDIDVNDLYIPSGETHTISGPADPKFAFNQTGYWAQGINFGLDYHW
jgi:hypothetical protein